MARMGRDTAAADLRPADVDTATRSSTSRDANSSGWGWRWIGWASWPVSPTALWIAAAALIVDIVSSWSGQPDWHIGRVLFSPALPLALLLVLVVGPRALGWSWRTLYVWREFLVLGVALVTIGGLAYPRSSAEMRDLQGIVLTLAAEELVYRLAAILLIGALCARLAGRDWRDTAAWGTGPAITALVGAGVVFSALPGHVAQITGASNVFAFLSLAVILGYAGLRSGSLLPAFVVHVALDLTTLSFLAGQLSGRVRVLVGVVVLAGLVLGLMAAGRRLGLRRRVPSVIDLRDESARSRVDQSDGLDRVL